MESRNAGRKFPQIVLVHVPGLLRMQYKVEELAEELGALSHTLMDWLNQ